MNVALIVILIYTEISFLGYPLLYFMHRFMWVNYTAICPKTGLLVCLELIQSIKILVSQPGKHLRLIDTGRHSVIDGKK